MYPSGAEFDTAWIDILVPAPGLFSMMTGCPSLSDSHALRIRTAASALPPGGKPTIQRNGRVG